MNAHKKNNYFDAVVKLSGPSEAKLFKIFFFFNFPKLDPSLKDPLGNLFAKFLKKPPEGEDFNEAKVSFPMTNTF